MFRAAWHKKCGLLLSKANRKGNTMTGHESTPSDRKSQALPKSQAVNSPQLELQLPPKILRYGLRGGNRWPLVASGRPGTRSYREFHVSPELAFFFPRFEIRTETAWPSLVFSLGGDGLVDVLRDKIRAGDIPSPNWYVYQKNGGECNVVFNLKSPVLRGSGARERPLKYYSRVSEFHGGQLGSDSIYDGVLTLNPLAKGHGTNFKTEWVRRSPYTLEELAEPIPHRWRSPANPKTHVGRTAALFLSSMRWAGSLKHLPLDVLSFGLIENQAFETPLDVADVRQISRAVEAYRSEWVEGERFYTAEEAEAWGREMGIQSGDIRRRRNRHRDRRIAQRVLKGQSQAGVAGHFKITQQMVSKIVSRDIPMWTRKAIGKPWLDEGISRRTWYRKKQVLI